MRTWLILATLIMSNAYGISQKNKEVSENRCGWWENSTPGNVDFIDRDKTWIVSMQGGFQAQGNWGPKGELEYQNGNHGKYCICIKGQFDKSSSKVIKIFSGTTKKLADCYNDKSLPGFKAPSTGALKTFIGQWISTNEDCISGRHFSIQASSISIEGEGVYEFKVIKEKPLWLESVQPEEGKSKFKRLATKSNGEIELYESSTSIGSPDGLLCILKKK